jgi:hypothetical protein
MAREKRARFVMRRCWAVIVFALLAAPFGVRAEEPAQPVPADRKCSIPADELWKPQEKFIWEQVCVGEEANFNKAAGYEGELDPNTPRGLPDSRVVSSAFLETILLKDKYRRALTRAWRPNQRRPVHGDRQPGERGTRA